MPKFGTFLDLVKLRSC